MPRPLAIACAAVALLDLVQLAARPWEPRLFGAVAGAVVYALAAGLTWRDRGLGAWIALLIPIIPVTTVLLWLASAPIPVAPDAWMLSIAGVQLIAAGLAANALFRPRTRDQSTNHVDA